MPNIFLGIFKTILTGFNPRLISQIYDVDHYEYHTVAPVGDTLHNKQSLSPNTIDISEYSSSRTWSDINGTDILHQITTLFTNIDSISGIPVNGLTSNIDVLIGGKYVAYASNISYFFVGGTGDELYARAVSPAFFYDDKIAVITATTKATAGKLTVSRWVALYVDDTAEVELIETDTIEFTVTAVDAKQQITLNLDASKCALLVGTDGFTISDINSTVFAPSILRVTEIPAIDENTTALVINGTRTYNVSDSLLHIEQCKYSLDDNCNPWTTCRRNGTHDRQTTITEDILTQSGSQSYTTGTNTGRLLAFGYDIESDVLNLLIERYGGNTTAEQADATVDTDKVYCDIGIPCWQDVYNKDDYIYHHTTSRAKTPGSLDRLEYIQGLADGYIGNPGAGAEVVSVNFSHSSTWERTLIKDAGDVVSDVTVTTYSKTDGQITVNDSIDIATGVFSVILEQTTQDKVNSTYDENKYFYDGKKGNLISTYSDQIITPNPDTDSSVVFGTEANYNRTDAPATTPGNSVCGAGCENLIMCPGEAIHCDYTSIYTYDFSAPEGNSFTGSQGEYIETWDLE